MVDIGGCSSQFCLSQTLRTMPYHRCDDSIVQKLDPPKIKLNIKDYFALHRSKKKMTKRLTAKIIRYAMGQLKKRQ